jgi:hypothetical protein
VGVEDLTDREKDTLYGLIRHPQLNDVELATELDMARSTVTVARKRFVDDGLISFTYVPDIMRLGCEVLTVLYGEFQEAGKDVDTVKGKVRKELKDAFYMLTHGGQHLSLSAAGSITDVGEHIRSHYRIHHDSGYLTDKRHNYILFPLQHTHITRDFDYAPLLAKHLGKEYMPETKHNIQCLMWRPTRREQKVMDALLTHSDKSDYAVSKAAKVSRQTVNAVKNRFLKEGFLKPKWIPNLRKLGFEFLSFTHLHMHPHTDRHGRKDHIRKAENPAQILKVAGDLETAVISAHPDYRDYVKTQKELEKAYGRNLHIIDEPRTQLYPLTESEHLLEHDYSGLLRT